MTIQSKFRVVKECPISELTEGDCVLTNGRVFRLRDRKHYPEDNVHHPNGVFTFRTKDLGDFHADRPSSIPAAWIADWVIQSNDNKSWTVVEERQTFSDCWGGDATKLCPKHGYQDCEKIKLSRNPNALIERARTLREEAIAPGQDPERKRELMRTAIQCLNSARAKTIGHKKRDRLENMVAQYALTGEVEADLWTMLAD